ncbi:hypothetical protein [Aquimarina algiphila]|nr:hypothetical protein [Aquimarina algiphila]
MRFSDHQIMNDMSNVLRAIESYILQFEETGVLPLIKDYGV